MTHKIVEGHGVPIRLDRYLRTLNSTLTQGIIERYLRKGLIKVNEAKVKANVRVVNGDIISYPETFIANDSEVIHNGLPRRCALRNDSAELLANKLLFEYLLYDHPSFYAFYKPSGLASQGGSRIGTSLDDALQILGLRLVHRLDKDTSGIMIAAKTRDDAIILTKAFADQRIYKTYFACVKSKPKKPMGQVRSYLARNNNFTGSSYDNEVEGSKLAITEYEVITFPTTNAEVAQPSYSPIKNILALRNGMVDLNKEVTLIKFTPQTGRMHQLRLHAKDLGCPIIGDKKYGGEENKYLMLHAYKIVLDESIFGEEIIITAPIPEYFLVGNEGFQ